MNKNKQMDADRRIKDGLDNLRPNYQAGSWSELAQRLDGDPFTSTDQAGDALLREKLGSIPAAPSSANWALLQQKMDVALDPATESDDLVREKLQTLTPAVALAGWEQLSARLDNNESDDLLHLRLNTHASTPPVSGWPALAAKLELIAARRVAIFSYKFSEVCLLLSALLLFWQFYPGNPASSGPIVQDFVNIEIGDTEAGEMVPAASTASATEVEENLIFRISTEPQNTLEATERLEVFAEAKTKETLTVLTIPSQQPGKLLSYEVSESIDQEEYALEVAPRVAPSPTLSSLLIAKKTERQFYLRPFVSPWDVNQVITPKQVVNDIILERDERISYGASLGVLLDVVTRKHAFQYGVIYGRRSYIPTVLKDVEDFIPGLGALERRDTNYSRISFQTISLPVSFQRELMNSGRWRIAAQAGLSADVNIWALFRKSPTFDQDVLDWTRQTSSSSNQRSNEDINVIDGHDLVYPEQGLLQGGSLRENINLSASIGLSIERQLSERMSIYLSPRFSRALYYQKSSGAEPFNDRIHNSSVQFGTRLLLGKRNK